MVKRCFLPPIDLTDYVQLPITHNKDNTTTTNKNKIGKKKNTTTTTTTINNLQDTIYMCGSCSTNHPHQLARRRNSKNNQRGKQAIHHLRHHQDNDMELTWSSSSASSSASSSSMISTSSSTIETNTLNAPPEDIMALAKKRSARSGLLTTTSTTRRGRQRERDIPFLQRRLDINNNNNNKNKMKGKATSKLNKVASFSNNANHNTYRKINHNNKNARNGGTKHNNNNNKNNNNKENEDDNNSYISNGLPPAIVSTCNNNFIDKRISNNANSTALDRALEKYGMFSTNGPGSSTATSNNHLGFGIEYTASSAAAGAAAILSIGKAGEVSPNNICRQRKLSAAIVTEKNVENVFLLDPDRPRIFFPGVKETWAKKNNNNNNIVAVGTTNNNNNKNNTMTYYETTRNQRTNNDDDDNNNNNKENNNRNSSCCYDDDDDAASASHLGVLQQQQQEDKKKKKKDITTTTTTTTTTTAIAQQQQQEEENQQDCTSTVMSVTTTTQSTAAVHAHDANVDDVEQLHQGGDIAAPTSIAIVTKTNNKTGDETLLGLDNDDINNNDDDVPTVSKASLWGLNMRHTAGASAPAPAPAGSQAGVNNSDCGSSSCRIGDDGASSHKNGNKSTGSATGTTTAVTTSLPDDDDDDDDDDDQQDDSLIHNDLSTMFLSNILDNDYDETMTNNVVVHDDDDDDVADDAISYTKTDDGTINGAAQLAVIVSPTAAVSTTIAQQPAALTTTTPASASVSDHHHHHPKHDPSLLLVNNSSDGDDERLYEKSDRRDNDASAIVDDGKVSPDLPFPFRPADNKVVDDNSKNNNNNITVTSNCHRSGDDNNNDEQSGGSASRASKRLRRQRKRQQQYHHHHHHHHPRVRVAVVEHDDRTWKDPPGLRYDAWSEGDATKFDVRGANYVQDGKKTKSEPSVFRLLMVDLVQSNRPITTGLCSHPSERIQHALDKEQKTGIRILPKFVFAINMCIPGSTASQCYHFVSYYGIDDLSVLNDTTTPFGRLAKPFFFGLDDGYRDRVFKLIPRVNDGIFVVRKAVGTQPSILGKKLKQYYIRTDRYMEVVIDIGSNAIAQRIVKLALGYSKTLAVDMMFLLEGNEPETQPERILAGVCVKHIDVKSNIDGQRIVLQETKL